MLYTEIILNFFFPKLCIGCDAHKNYLCKNCEENIALAKNDLPDWIFAKYNYKDENIKKLLFKLKYFHVKSIANELALYASPYLNSKLEKNKDYILIPIPVTAKRHRDRGYNQSKLIAVSLAKESSNLKVLEILKRIRETKKLNKIKTREERQIELEDAFAMDSSKSISLDSHIIIIDDIATTGASLYSARKTLTEFGFKKDNILAFTIAH